MVTTKRHQELMNDANLHNTKNGPLAGKRREHLDHLTVVESLFRSASKLPTSYDVSRAQPPYFNEFTHTEALGAFLVFPQSTEVATRLVEQAVVYGQTMSFDLVGSIMDRLKDSQTLDKYTMTDVVDDWHDDVIFLPGSNIFDHSFDKAAVSRIMAERPRAVIKPHPLTNEIHIRQLGMMYGYHRILEPMASGYAYLQAAKRVWYTSSTEMGLYAMLLEKETFNISNYMTEFMGAYAPFYINLRNLSPKEANQRLRLILSSNYSGIFHPDDPYLVPGIEKYLKLAMEIREMFRPRAAEYTPMEYSKLILSSGAQPQQPQRK